MVAILIIALFCGVGFAGVAVLWISDLHKQLKAADEKERVYAEQHVLTHARLRKATEAVARLLRQRSAMQLRIANLEEAAEAPAPPEDPPPPASGSVLSPHRR